MLTLVESADVLIEGMRPGVTERMGIGPDDCLARNPGLVYGRMTGWGQTGPLAKVAGHDINYVAIAGALHGSGQDPSRPHFASNLVGDFGGGSTYLVIGLLAALIESRVSGRGQVVDAAIVDGTAHLNMMWASMLAGGSAIEQRAVNLLDGGIPNYTIYETSDAKHLAVGPLEPQFCAELLRLAEIDPAFAADPARLGEALTADLPVQDPGGVDGRLRALRRLCHRHPPPHRGRRAPAHAGTRGLRDEGRTAPARSRPAVLTDRGDPHHGPQRTRGKHPRGSRGVGDRQRRRAHRRCCSHAGVTPRGTHVPQYVR